MKKIIRVILCMAVVIFLVRDAHALNVQAATPNIGPTGTFNTFGARTPKRKHFTVGFMADFTRDPLEFRNWATGGHSGDVVRYLFTNDIVGEYSIIDSLLVGVDIPLQVSRHILSNDITQRTTKFGIGDVKVYGKYAILHPDKYPVGFSVMPYVTAPSGRASDYVGDDNVDVGGNLIVDKEFTAGYIGLNVGIKGRTGNDSVAITSGGATSSMNVGSEFTYGGGGSFDILGKKLQAVAEVRGSTVLTHFGQDEKTSPVEIDGGFKSVILDDQLSIYAGGGGGLNGGYSAPQYRIMGGLTYHHPAHRHEPKEAKAAAPAIEEGFKCSQNKVVLTDIQFEDNLYSIVPSYKKLIAEKISQMRACGWNRVNIDGHTDSRGSVEYNQRLSERRANEVGELFKKDGLTVVSLKGHGKLQPIAPNDTPANTQKNRRVEITVVR